MKIFFALCALLISSSAFAQSTYVKPYVRSDGTYVNGHYRSAPNNSTWDNYSTQGNTNPYTGQSGYKDPYSNSNNSYDYKSNNYNRNNY